MWATPIEDLLPCRHAGFARQDFVNTNDSYLIVICISDTSRSCTDGHQKRALAEQLEELRARVAQLAPPDTDHPLQVAESAAVLGAYGDDEEQENEPGLEFEAYGTVNYFNRDWDTDEFAKDALDTERFILELEYRFKDRVFTRGLARRRLVMQKRLLDLLKETPVSEEVRDRIQEDIRRDFERKQL